MTHDPTYRAERRAELDKLSPLARRAVERLAAALHHPVPEGTSYPDSWLLGFTQFAVRSLLFAFGLDGDDQEDEKGLRCVETPVDEHQDDGKGTHGARTPDGDQEAVHATVPGTWPGGEPTTVRPSWLPDGCPSWCEEAGRHAEGDHFDDRIHCGPAAEMVLTAAGRDVDDIDNGPNTARLYLLQHYREVGPRIELCRDDRPTGIQLTLDEGAEFADELLRLVEVARLAVDTGDEDGPVAERSTGPLCATAWASPGRVDVLRDERRPDWERPLTPGEATDFAGKLLDLAAIADGAQR